MVVLAYVTLYSCHPALEMPLIVLLDRVLPVEERKLKVILFAGLLLGANAHTENVYVLINGIVTV